MSGDKGRSITIVGAGAIGGWVAAKLSLSGQKVSILARAETLDALRSDGLRLTEGGATTSASVTVSGNATELGPQDVLVIAVKAPALAEAAATARPLINPETLIIPMLNGVPWWFTPGEPIQCIDPDGGIAQALPTEQVIGCVVHAACSRLAPNHVRITHADRLILGEPADGKSERVSRLVQLFEECGIPAEQSDNVRRETWYKLWGNATLNPLSALTRATGDRLLGDSVLWAFMLEGMEELATVGAAIGCPIEESGEDRMAVTARLGRFKTSMLQDVEAGRRIELEALLGAPREFAARFGIPTPKLDLLYAQTRLMGQSLGLL